MNIKKRISTRRSYGGMTPKEEELRRLNIKFMKEVLHPKKKQKQQQLDYSSPITKNNEEVPYEDLDNEYLNINDHDMISSPIIDKYANDSQPISHDIGEDSQEWYNKGEEVELSSLKDPQNIFNVNPEFNLGRSSSKLQSKPKQNKRSYKRSYKRSNKINSSQDKLSQDKILQLLANKDNTIYNIKHEPVRVDSFEKIPNFLKHFADIYDKTNTFDPRAAQEYYTKWRAKESARRKELRKNKSSDPDNYGKEYGRGKETQKRSREYPDHDEIYIPRATSSRSVVPREEFDNHDSQDWGDVRTGSISERDINALLNSQGQEDSSQFSLPEVDLEEYK